jgi:hypothetical protein
MKGAILLGAAALGLLPVCAEARDFHRDRYDGPSRYREVRRERHESYRVFYRRDAHCGWISEGCYGCRSDAERAISHLRHHGYEARFACD